MGFIRLGGERTKNKIGQNIPLHPRIIEFLRTCPRPIDGVLSSNEASGNFKPHLERD